MSCYANFRRALLCVAVAISAVSGQAAPLKVGLVLDKGGKDDKSFNAAAYRGAKEAEGKFKIDLKTVEMTDANSSDSLIRSLATRNYDLIIAIGFVQGDAIKANGLKFPDRKFVVVDAEVPDVKNVRSAMFQEHEGSFLAGAAAAMASKTGKLGYIGGMKIPMIQRFLLGYEAGAKYINPKVTVTSAFVGFSGEAWNNPTKAKELALAQYSSGIDVVFGAAGGSTSGIFDAAENKNALAIGVDSNQNWVKPGHILTSMMKRVDVAVYKAIEDTVNGKFTAGVVRHGIADEGVDLAVDENNKKLWTPAIDAKIKAIKKDILSGKVQVPDFYKTQGK